MKKYFTLLFLFIFYSGFSVKRNVPASYSTIQSALNACNQGDTVLVQPGTYTENIYWPKIKNIKLFSAGDSSNTIINANFVGRCFTIVDSSYALIDTNTVISGFRLINGYSDTTAFCGAGVYSYGTQLVIEKCAITNCNVNAVNSNTASILSGGVIHYDIKTLTLRDCALYGNSVYNSSGQIRGGLIYAGSSAGSILHGINMLNNQVSIISQGSNSISGALVYTSALSGDKMKILNNNVNYLGSSGPTTFNAFLYGSNSGATLSNCLIANNTFLAGMTVNMTALVILAPSSNTFGWSNLAHLTIADNRAVSSGSIGAISYYGVGGSSFSWQMTHNLTNCIFWNPYNSSYDEVNRSTSNSKFNMTFCDVRKYSSNILPVNCYSVVPKFVSPTDYHLQTTSPCINLGALSTIIPMDLDGNSRPLPAATFLDIGCYEMNQSTTTLTPNASIASTVTCQSYPFCIYNSTPNTKNRLWSITPYVPGWPVSQDSVCLPINGAGSYTISLILADSSNAIGTASFVVNVLPSPTITLAQSSFWICSGQSATLTSNSTGTYSSVQWSTGQTTQSIAVSPTVLTTYSVTYTNSYGCSSMNSVSVNYTNAPAPTITISATSNTLCAGQTITLSASYTSTSTLWPYWSPGGYAVTLAVTPTVNTVYSSTLSDGSTGCIGVSNQLSITVNTCTDLHEKIDHPEIKIFPNPSSGSFFINIASVEKMEYEIYNCLGQKISSGWLREKTEVSLKEEGPGIYFVKILEGKRLILTKKIIVNN